MDRLILSDTYVKEITKCLRSSEGLSVVPGLVRQLIEMDLWRERPDKASGTIVEFNRFSDFVKHRYPVGLSTTIDKIEKLCEDDPEVYALLMKVDAGKGGVAGNAGINQHTKKKEAGVDIINTRQAKTKLRSDTGTSKKQAMRRLAKDVPDLYQRVLDGEMSAHRAMVNAGFRKEKIQIPVDDPKAAAAIIKRKFDVEGCRILVDELRRIMERNPQF